MHDSTVAPHAAGIVQLDVQPRRPLVPHPVVQLRTAFRAQAKPSSMAPSRSSSHALQVPATLGPSSAVRHAANVQLGVHVRVPLEPQPVVFYGKEIGGTLEIPFQVAAGPGIPAACLAPCVVEDPVLAAQMPGAAFVLLALGILAAAFFGRRA